MATARVPLAALIRTARHGDAADVAQLLGELGYPCSTPDAALRIAQVLDEDRQELVVADFCGQIQGLLALDRMYYLPLGRETCRITALIVAADARNSGLGRALVRHAEAWAKQHACARIEVTSAAQRTEAHAFYAACGYQQSSLRFVKIIGDA